jgi:hypothetical protein
LRSRRSRRASRSLSARATASTAGACRTSRTSGPRACGLRTSCLTSRRWAPRGGTGTVGPAAHMPPSPTATRATQMSLPSCAPSSTALRPSRTWRRTGARCLP